jgi:hypothetical protein
MTTFIHHACGAAVGILVLLLTAAVSLTVLNVLEWA